MRSIKRVLSIVLSCLMLISMVAVGTVSASAAALVEGDTLYLVPNSNWKVDNARFAVYMWGNGNTWVSMTDSDNDGVYEATVPAGTWNNLIFCRMSPSNTTNDWNNKWNQTGDLTWDGTNNCYTINEGQWDSGQNGKWSYIDDEVDTTPSSDTTPSEDPVTETTVTLTSAQGVFEDATKTVAVGDTFTVAVMLQADLAVQDGQFETKFDSNALKVTAQEINLAAGYQSNISENTQKEFNTVYLNFTDSEKGFDFATEANVVVYTFEVLEGTTAEETITVDCVALTGMVRDDLTGVTQTEYITNREVIATEGYALTAVFETEEDTDPTESTSPSESSEATNPSESDTTPTIPSESDTTPAPAKEYCLFGYIGGANYGCEEDNANIGEYIFADGTLTATFDQTAYVAVKTTDNANWYMTDGWLGEVTEATLYTTNITGEKSDKLMIPAGTVTFTLVENADGTLTLSYVVDGDDTDPSESDTTPSQDTNPSESDTTPSQDTNPTDDTDPSDPVDTYTTIYIQPDAGWKSDNAAFVAHPWDDALGYDWVLMTDEDGDGIYSGQINTKYTEILFCRVNPDGPFDTWGENVWNQTVDMAMPTDANILFIVTDPWGNEENGHKATGTWTPVPPVTSDPTDPSDDTDPTESTSPSESSEATNPSESDTTPTIPSESDTTPAPAKEYCLFGYIGGANYGCEEDNANIGEYIFADGTLTATFDQTAYVAVKTTDNANWYMTDGWLGEVTEATLYTTDITGEKSDKLMIPAGTVTFTLVENADGTLTLSYTVAADTTPSSSSEPSESTTPSQSESSESTSPSQSESSESTAPSQSEPSESTTPSQSEPSESTTPSESEPTPTTPQPTTPKPTQPVKKPYLNITSAKVKAGATVKLEVKDNNTGAKPKFSVDDKEIVKVSAKGKVTALKKGTAMITATVGSTKLTCKVKVTTNPKLTNTKGKKISKVTIGVGGKATKILISGKAAKLKNQYKSTAYVKVTGGKQKPFIKIKGLKAGKSTLEIKVNRSKTLKLKVTVE